MKIRFLITLILFYSSSLLAYSVPCGTERLANFSKNFSSFRLAQKTISKCAPELFFDSIYNQQTEHFIVFYTLDGPHATKKEFIDTLTRTLEKVYSLFVQTHKTLPPLGIDTSYHYQQPVPNHLYPIEVLDLSLTRNINTLMGGCEGCFALTLPDGDSERSTILLDNDFKYPASNAESVFLPGDSCSYQIPNQELNNATYNYSYAKNFTAGIQITIAHEMYHAVQIRYLNFLKHYSYWFEASATGMEDVFAPDINDYLANLKFLLNFKWNSFENIQTPYALAALFLLLYHDFGATLDTKIWNDFKKFKTEPWETHFANVLKENHLNPDSVFHHLAERLFFSGQRVDSTDINKSFPDLKLWPTASVSYSEKISDKFPYFTYREGREIPTNSAGYFSFLILNKGDSVYKRLEFPKDTASDSDFDERNLRLALQKAERSILVYSQLLRSTPIADSSAQKEKRPLFAFPNPWKSGALCFDGLPENETILEIRTSRGSLVRTYSYAGTPFCIEEKSLQEDYAPGLYFFRAGRHGKPKKLLITH